MVKQFTDVGRKTIQRNIEIEKLHVDVYNPRLPENIQGKSEDDIIYYLKKETALEELAYSLATNGYFDEEPLVAVPIKLPDKKAKKDDNNLPQEKTYESFVEDSKTEFIVVEGNRRLSAAKLLLSDTLRNKLNIRTWPEISDVIRKDLMVLPVIIYPAREIVFQYLGARHIVGVRKWDPFEKARYIANLVEQGYDINDIQNRVGDRSNSVRKIYFCYRLVEVAKNRFDIDTKEIEAGRFSYLLLATGQGNIKDYLGMPESWQDVNFKQPVSSKNIDNLKNLFSILFGEGKDKIPAINESRDITNYLSLILKNKKATERLLLTRDMLDAYEMTPGEELQAQKYIEKANIFLEKSLGLIQRHKTQLIKEEVRKCIGTINTIKDILKI